MHWKLKSKIQNAIALLPSSASYAAYYQMQRRFGGLRRVNPVRKLLAGIETGKLIIEQGWELDQKTFLEIGTGRVILVPLAYWLMGAKKTITIDLNPYLKEELIAESLEYIVNNEVEIRDIFGSLLNQPRFDDLLRYAKTANFSTGAFLDLCQIDYLAPSDATDTKLPPQSIDFHTSYTVFEHIPGDTLKQILQEGNRIIRDNGLFVHKVDYSDHFSHSDRNISPINFLQYSDDQWDKYAGNRYMYMNRLRHDDFIDLFESVGQDIVEVQTSVSQRAQQLLQNNDFPLNAQFQTKSKETLSISSSWIISQKKVAALDDSRR